jgi:hypothetical protein
VNGNVVYTQSFATVESFVQDQIVTELVRNTSQYMYSSWENVMTLSPNVCGTYIKIDVSAANPGLNANTQIPVRIPLKIPIERFMILKNLKYMLSWMGKWEIRCYFDWRGLVIMPVDPLKILTSYYGASELSGASERSFTQIGDPFTGITSLTLGTFAVNGGGPHDDWVLTLVQHAAEV